MVCRFMFEVSGPSLVTYLNGAPIFEECVVNCGSKNTHRKDTCFVEDWECQILGPSQQFGYIYVIFVFVRTI